MVLARVLAVCLTAAVYGVSSAEQLSPKGRIVIRDGCFFVIGHDRSEKLAYFAREVGLGVDSQGYLALHRRTAERPHLGRIGEMFTWSGPIAIDETAPMVTELRDQCGNAPLMHVGIPESRAIVNARYCPPRGLVSPPRRTIQPEPSLQPSASPVPPAPMRPPSAPLAPPRPTTGG